MSSISLNNLNLFTDPAEEQLDNNAFMMYCAYTGVVQHFMGYTNVFFNDPFVRFRKDVFMSMSEEAVKKRMMFRYVAQRFIESQSDPVSRQDMITAFVLLFMDNGQFQLKAPVVYSLITTFKRYKASIAKSNNIIQKDIMYLIKEARAKNISFDALLRSSDNNSFPFIYWEFMGRRLNIMTLYALSDMFTTLGSNPGKLTLFEFYTRTYADNEILLEHMKNRKRWVGVYKFDWEYIAKLFMAAKRMTEK
jgi:hypothetical protein